jgi:hypothetical protein
MTTKVTDLVVPKVIGDAVQKKLGKLIKFAPLAELDSNLQGHVGNSITVPSWNYIGDASDVAEGVAITAENISAGSIDVTVKKAVKDIAMTDESVLATNGEVVGQVEQQLAVSIANKIDEDALVQLTATATSATVPQIPQQIATATISQSGLAQLRVYFGEDLEDTFLAISVADYAKVLSLPEFVSVEQGQAFMSGHVGQVMGLNIIVSGRLASGKAVLLQQGGLGIAIKREVNTESERDMTTRSTRLGADVHYACYIKNPAKVANIVALS